MLVYIRAATVLVYDCNSRFIFVAGMGDGILHPVGLICHSSAWGTN